MNHHFSYYEETRNLNGQQYETYHEMAIACSQLANVTEFDISFQRTVEMYRTPSELRHLVGTIYEQGGDSQ